MELAMLSVISEVAVVVVASLALVHLFVSQSDRLRQS